MVEKEPKNVISSTSQEEPEVCTVMDFVFTHEETYLVHWYANWRKWPAIYNSWRNVGSRECVPLPLMETQRSLLNHQIGRAHV